MRSRFHAAGIAFLSAGLLGCLTMGPELTPYTRPDVEGFVVTVHRTGVNDFQIAVWHPQRHFYSPQGENAIPFQAKLIGDPQMPITNLTEAFEYTKRESRVGIGAKAGPVYAGVSSTQGSSKTVTERTARTGWTFTPTRWAERRPFRLVLIRGFKPLTEEKRMEIEITLGPTIGSAEGLTVRKVSMDPIPEPLS